MSIILKKFPTPLFIILIAFFINNALGYTILLDPGHGGEDQGARAKIITKLKGGKTKISYIYEKDLVLKIAKIIYKKLKKTYNVFLTRSIDRTVHLEERAEMADKVKADLVISIHVNSSPKATSNGFETYYLNNHNDVAVKKVEAIENKGLLGEELIIQQILTDLIVEKTVSISKSLATNIHSQVKRKISKKFKMKDRGVKAGLFYVLALSKRPGVLLEVGFISNKRELKKIVSPVFWKSFANAVYLGINRFIKKAKKDQPPLL